jgi:hypothetical protein
MSIKLDTDGFHSLGARVEDGVLTVTAQPTMPGDYHLIHVYNSSLNGLLKIPADMKQLLQWLEITFTHELPPHDLVMRTPLMAKAVEIYTSPQKECFIEILKMLLQGYE